MDGICNKCGNKQKQLWSSWYCDCDDVSNKQKITSSNTFEIYKNVCSTHSYYSLDAIVSCPYCKPAVQPSQPLGLTATF